MPRCTILTALLAACLLAPVQAGARFGPSQDAAASLAWVKVSSCSRLDHTAAFYGRMNRVAGTTRMSMRFTLFERSEKDVFAQLKAPGLSRWRKSKPDVRAFGYRQRVRGLVDGSLYRVQVDYRWYDEDGEVIRRAHRRSRACSQAGPLPNLRVKLVDSSPTAIRGVTRYRVRVANRGAADADAVDVRLAVDGSAVDTQTVDRLEPGQVVFLSFRGPSCESDVQASVDPGGMVRETAEDDNVQTRGCAELPPG